MSSNHIQEIINGISNDIYSNGGGYINPLRYYSAIFQCIPNKKMIDHINLIKAREFILEYYKDEIKLENYSQNYDYNKKEIYYKDHFVVLKNNLVINLFEDAVHLLYTNDLENYATDFLDKMIPFKIKERKANTTEISLIVKGSYGLETKELKVEKPNLNIDLHYNDDFKEIHNSILTNIKKETKGLYLFYGLPGTGKSTYIKYLIHQQKKKVIFLPPNMAGNIDSMEWTEFLIENPGCIIVVEDAEDLIVSREDNYNTRLSFLLNITDGILSDSLGIQIIATFNTNLKNKDKALVRKGRLTSIYEFKELEVKKANELLKKLKHDKTTHKAMSLADIFNINADLNYKPRVKKSVGY